MSYALELATTPRGGAQRCAGGAIRWVRRAFVLAALVCGFWLLGALLDSSSASAASPAQSPGTATDSSHKERLLGGLVAQLDQTTTQLTTTVDDTVPGAVHDVVHVVHHTVHAAVHGTVAPTVREVVRTATETVQETVQTVENTLANTGHSLPAPVSNPVRAVGQAVGSTPRTDAVPKPAKVTERVAATPRQQLVTAPVNVASNAPVSTTSAGLHDASHGRALDAMSRGAAAGLGARHPQAPQPSAPSIPAPDKGLVDPGTSGSSRYAENDIYVLGSDAPRATACVLSSVRHESRALHGATNSRPDVSPD